MSGTEIIMMKHGSSSVENANHIGINQDKINFHVTQHVRLRESGLLTVETASGATVEGKEYALEIGKSLEDYDDDIEFAQEGTARQVRHWEEAARPYGISVKQALLTNYAIDAEIDSQEKKLIIPGVLKAVKKGSLVVINEDPFAADEEMEEYEESQIAQEQDKEDVEPDNDGLASHASIAIGAAALLLLSNVQGLKINGKVRRIVRVEEIDEMILHCDGASQSGKGGMKAKLLAAEQAARAGIHVVIGSAFIDDVGRLLEGDAGTTVIR
jgi:glutamate 5-kinase